MSRENNKDTYHHGDLKAELVRLGLLHLEREGEVTLSLRRLAEAAGVSKNAPYRHFRSKEVFLGELINEGFRLLYQAMKERAERELHGATKAVAVLGGAYMDFAVEHPALYRLMNSPLVCRLPDELNEWPRKALMYLADTLAGGNSGTEKNKNDLSAATAAWAYIHGLVMLRIDHLFPEDLPEPDWDTLAGSVDFLSVKGKL